MAGRRAPISLKIEGLKPYLKAMQSLKGSAQRRVLRKAITDATKPVLKTAKAKAPKDSGLLRKSLGRKTVTLKKRATVIGMVGPRTGFKKEVTVRRSARKPSVEIRDPNRYAHLVEFGTSHSAARPFLRPAWDANLSKVKTIMTKRMGKEIEIEAAKAAKKAGMKTGKRGRRR